MKQIFKVFFLLIWLHSGSNAQNFDLLEIPIFNEGKKLDLSNVGGLKAPQFSNIDFNADGKMDIFIFDRNGDKIIPLVKTGIPGQLTYRYAPEYIDQFPELRVFALLKDYNNDGILDIFTTAPLFPGGVAVWKGIKNANGANSYEKVTFNNSFYREILHFSNDGSNFANIYVSSIDLPAITDVDGDGDVDIISFEADGSFASFYRNLAIEDNLGIDILKFDRPTICWGSFSENQFNENITLSDNPFSCAQGLNPGNPGSRHSGSSLTVFDTNGDGLQDMIIGDLGSSKLKKLINRGTKSNAWVRELEINFPADDIPVDLEYFLAAYFVDVDDDGKRDLIIAPNEINSAENSDHIWMYTNIGTDANPKFKLVQKNFLIDQMAYFYGGSHPAFADVDVDGLIDIVVGTSGIQKKKGEKENRIIFIKNIGSTSNPSFEIVDQDYLDFSEINGKTNGRFAPTFGDLDSDGATDLVIGDAVGQLFYFRNNAPKNKPCQFSSPGYPFADVFVGQNAKPMIIDLDNDGLQDLVLGEKNNRLNFLKNVGQQGNPIFNNNLNAAPNTRSLGKFFQGSDIPTQNGAPVIITTTNNKRLMVFGTNEANFRLYEVTADTFPLLMDFMGNIKEGSRVISTLADIDNDGYYEMAVGNDRGGLAFYNTIFKVDTTSSTEEDMGEIAPITIFPNPAHNEIYIFTTLDLGEIILYNVQGQEIMSLQNNASNHLSLDLNSGLYIIKMKHASGTFSRKLLIQN